MTIHLSDGALLSLVLFVGASRSALYIKDPRTHTQSHAAVDEFLLSREQQSVFRDHVSKGLGSKKSQIGRGVRRTRSKEIAVGIPVG